MAVTHDREIYPDFRRFFFSACSHTQSALS
jgi:hypothetical protein